MRQQKTTEAEIAATVHAQNEAALKRISRQIARFGKSDDHFNYLIHLRNSRDFVVGEGRFPR